MTHLSRLEDDRPNSAIGRPAANTPNFANLADFQHELRMSQHIALLISTVGFAGPRKSILEMELGSRCWSALGGCGSL